MPKVLLDSLLTDYTVSRFWRDAQKDGGAQELELVFLGYVVVEK